ncbi:hypothetical protein pEaSNUABM11_00203 [Erwinia phage pEa_SNUABM_11]|nr:hypothetical protein pEaSNUABM11_00203 [Erwinia phage pEa_SNUABM_11]
MVYQDFAAKKNQDAVNNIVHNALTDLKGKYHSIRTLTCGLRDVIVTECNKHFEVSSTTVYMTPPESSVNSQWYFTIDTGMMGFNPFEVSVSAERMLCAVSVDRYFSNSLKHVTDRITAILGECKTSLGPTAGVGNYVADANNRLKIELQCTVYSFITEKLDWVVYAVSDDTRVELIGSWALPDFVPELFEQVNLTLAEPESVPENLPHRVSALLNRVGSIIEQPTRSVSVTALTRENLFRAIKAYMRLLHNKEKVTFNYNVTWETDSELMNPSLRALLPADAPRLIETMGLFEMIRGRASLETYTTLLNEHSSSSLASHISVTVSGVSDKVVQWSFPIDKLITYSGAAIPNTSDAARNFWTVPEVGNVREEQVEKPDVVYSLINQGVQALSHFKKQPETGNDLKKALHTMWTEVGRHYGTPGQRVPLPRRAITALLADFAEWIDTYGRGYVTNGDDYSASTFRSEFTVEYVLREWTTGRSEALLFTWSDFEPYISACLDWHPAADTFFIPRQG